MSILDLLQVYQYDTKIRLGVNHDGGYVIGDLSGAYDLYISAGVSNEESFSRDFIAKYNMNETNSYAFDGTIEDYPYNYTKNITFIKKQIGGLNNDTATNLSFLIDKYSVGLDLRYCLRDFIFKSPSLNKIVIWLLLISYVFFLI